MSCDLPMFPIQVRQLTFSWRRYARAQAEQQACFAIFSGLIPTRTSQAGARTTEVFHSRLDRMLFRASYKNTTWI